MVIATLSEKFAEEADGLPKDAKAKQFKTLRLLTTNPRHPSLQFKKIQGSPRDDVYECRVDQFWRLIVRVRDNAMFDLIHVGPHDEAIGLGVMYQRMRWLAHFPIITDYLAGDDTALAFTPWDRSKLRRVVDSIADQD